MKKFQTFYLSNYLNVGNPRWKRLYVMSAFLFLLGIGLSVDATAQNFPVCPGGGGSGDAVGNPGAISPVNGLITNGVFVAQSNEICIQGDGSNNGVCGEDPEWQMDIAIPVSTLPSCSDISIRVCRRGDFGQSNEVVFVYDEFGSEVGVVPGLTGVQFDCTPGPACTQITIDPCSFNAQAGDGVFSLVMYTNGAIGGNTVGDFCDLPPGPQADAGADVCGGTCTPYTQSVGGQFDSQANGGPMVDDQCTGCNCLFLDYLFYDVDPVGVEFEMTPTAVCPNEDVVLAPEFFCNQSWTVDGGTTGLTATSGVTTFNTATPGSYTICNTTGNLACPLQECKTLVVHPAPTVSDPVDIGPLCDGDPANFSATESGGTAPYTYVWELSNDGGTTYSTISDDATFQNSATSSLDILSAPTSFDGSMFRMTVIDANGCEVTSNPGTLTMMDCQPEIELTKTQVSMTEPAASGISGNADAVYEFTICNTGPVDVSNIDLIDNLFSQFGSGFVGVVAPPLVTGATTAAAPPTANAAYNGFAGNDNLLNGDGTLTTGAPGECVTIELAIELDLSNLPPGAQNSATASGTSPQGLSAEDDAAADVPPNPVIGVAKSVSEIVPSTDPDEYLVTFQMIVENLGNTDFTSVELFDDLADPSNVNLSCAFQTDEPVTITVSNNSPGATVMPAANAAYTSTNTGVSLLAATPVDFRPGQSFSVFLTAVFSPNGCAQAFANQAVANGDGPGGPASDVSDDGADPAGGDDPTPFTLPGSIAVTKDIINTAPAASGVAGNYDVTFEFEVCNDGGVNMSQINLEDDFGTQFGSAFVGVVGGALGGSTVTAVETGTADVNTSTPTAENGYLGMGGNIALLMGDGELIPGECVAVQVVVEVDISESPATGLNNQASASGTDPSGNVAEDLSDDSSGGNDTGGTNDPTPLMIPEISVDKSIVEIVPSSTPGNSLITFEITVENTGTVPLTDLTMFDDVDVQLNDAYVGIDAGPTTTFSAATMDPSAFGTFPPDIWDGTAGGEIKPGEYITVQFTVEVIDANLDDPQTNTASAGGTDPNGGTVSGMDDTVIEVPSIGLAKAVSTANPPMLLPNGNFLTTFDLVVENTGNVELSDVSVTDDLLAQFGCAYQGNVTLAIADADGDVAAAGGIMPTTDASYNGASPTVEMLVGPSTLPVGTEFEITLSLEMNPYCAGAPVPLSNQAKTSATGPDGTSVEDLSEDGTDPNGNDSPTLLTFPCIVHADIADINTSCGTSPGGFIPLTQMFITDFSIGESAAGAADGYNTMTGGTFSGTGVSGGVLQYTGPGCYPIDYTVELDANCSATFTGYVVVNATPEPSFDLPGFCWDGAAPTTTTAAITSPIYGADIATTVTWEANMPGTTGNTATAATVDATGVVTISAAGDVEICMTESNVVAGCSTNSTPNTCDATVCTTITISAIDITLVGTDPVCFGGASGSVDNTTIGGQPPYSFAWNNGASSANLSGVTAGTYTVIVTDANGCTATDMVTLSEPATPLTGAVVPVDAQCDSQEDGSATVTASGGTGPYSYWLSTGETTTDGIYSTLASGGYTYIITDANGCTFQGGFEIDDPNSLELVVTSEVDEVCNENDDGMAGVAASGGTAPYTFVWSGTVTQTDAATTSDASDMAAGFYTVTVTDAAGCSATQTLEIEQPNILQVSLVSQTNVDCNGNATGEAVIAAAGASPYTFTSTAGTVTGNTVTGLAAGTHTVTATDANGCQGTLDVIITEPAALTLSLVGTDPICFGDAIGMAVSTVAGGTEEYHYSWSNGSAGANLMNVAAGTYTLTVTDENGCTVTESVTLSEPAVPMTASHVTTDADCNSAETGSVVITGADGVAPYTYWISTGATNTTGSFTDLASGGYIYLVTDANGCTYESAFEIDDPSTLTLIVTSEVDEVCNENDDGMAAVLAAGGTAPYTFVWSGTVTQVDAGATSDASDMAAGFYTVTVTDAQGCTAVQTLEIEQPSVLQVGLINQTNVDCNANATGEVVVDAAGTPPYTFASTGGTVSGNTVSGLAAGTYTITATDGNGCQGTLDVTITEPPVLTVSLVGTDPACSGDASGLIVSTTAGGTEEYHYSWSNGSAGANLVNAIAGTYTLTVTDENGCIATATATLTDPIAVTSSFATTDADCDSAETGSVVITGADGVAPYDYWISTGATNTTGSFTDLAAGGYIYTVTDANGCSTEGAFEIDDPSDLGLVVSSEIDEVCDENDDGIASVTASGGTPPYTFVWTGGTQADANISPNEVTDLAAGFYTVVVTDAQGCTATQTVEIEQPESIDVVLSSQTNITCNGGADGSIVIDATGGLAPYTFTSTGGTVAGNTVTDLAAGTYTITVTDINGCENTLDVTITEPALLEIEIEGTDPLCNGTATGSVEVTVLSGGTPEYSFIWSNGSTDMDLTNVVAGIYTVTVFDDNLCFASATVTLVDPPAVTATHVTTDADCNSEETGSVIITPADGVAPYLVLLSTGEVSTGAFTTLATGGYTYIVTDANDCQFEGAFEIDDPSGVELVVTAENDEICDENDDGSASVVASGGTPPYTYLWNDPAAQTTATASNLGAGFYTVVVTDAQGCTATQTAEIEQPESVDVVLSSQVNVSCNGNADGSVVIDATGGLAPYTFTSTGGTVFDNTVNDLAAGTYTITVTDINGCQNTLDITITEPDVLEIQIEGTDPICNGTATGMVEVTVLAGGTPEYHFLWTNGSTDFSLENVVAGIYSVTVFDDNLCFANATVTLVDPPAVAASHETTDADCNSEETGSVIIKPSEGVAPFSFWLSNGETNTTGEFTTLATGGYIYIVTDANGCTFEGAFEIDDPTGVELVVTEENDETCDENDDGSASVLASGGTPPYTYLWDDPAAQTAATAIDLAAGFYTVVVTDGQGCTAVQTVEIEQPESVDVVLSSQTNVSCNGNADGSVVIDATGGLAPYTFTSTGGTVNGNTVSDLAVGAYTITVTDINGCQNTLDITITEPELLEVEIEGTDPICFGTATGRVEISMVTGGTLEYHYLWSNGSTDFNLEDVVAGTYTVFVFDENNCVASATTTIVDPAAVTASHETTDADCNSEETGSVVITGADGVLPYTYALSTGETNTTGVFTTLATGGYIYTVTDANGCLFEGSFEIDDPTGVELLVTSEIDETCDENNDGSASVLASGGTPPYTYQWNDAAGQTAATATNLSAGFYTVVVTDAQGCTAVQTAEIEQPESVDIVLVSQENVDCNGNSNGSVVVDGTGGLAPYTFTSTGGTVIGNTVSGLASGIYTITITDANACQNTLDIYITHPTVLQLTLSGTNPTCNGEASGSVISSPFGGVQNYSYEWSNGSTDINLINVPAGTYSLTVTDANGCTTSASYTLTDPLAVTGSHTTTDADCDSAETGSVSIVGANGFAPYTYSLSNGEANLSGNFSTLASGGYAYTITDANGCTYEGAFEIDDPSDLQLIVTSEIDETCNEANDGSATVQASGGTPPYTFNWSFGNQGNSFLNPFQGASSTNVGMPAGFHSVVVTDAQGCTATQTVEIEEPQALDITLLSQTNVDCYGNSTGSVVVAGTGGTAPYSFSSSSGLVSGSMVTGMPAGIHKVTITDANGCENGLFVFITQPNQLSISLSGINPTCNGEESGMIVSSTFGGTEEYHYAWSNGSTGANLINVSAGTYTVVITDENGCTASASATLVDPTPVFATHTVTNASCDSQESGSVNITGLNGVPPYLYSLSTGELNYTGNFSTLAAGGYIYTVTDVNGCSYEGAFEVDDPSDLELVVVSEVDEACNEYSNGSASVQASGGTPPYSFAWSGGTQASQNTNPNQVVGLAAGFYAVTVTDAQGCSTVQTIEIEQPESLDIVLVSQTNVDCTNSATGSVVVDGTGGTAPYTYASTSGLVSSNTVSNLVAGTHIVTITDANGCQSSMFVNITQSSPLGISLSGTNPGCNGESTGMIQSFATGGTTGYSYLWNNGSTDANLMNVPAGIYTVVVTDANDCTSTASVILNDPAAITAIHQTVNAACDSQESGSVVITGGNGALPYVYHLSNGVSSFFGTFTGLASGGYTYVVEDANGCTFQGAFNIDDPNDLELVIVAENDETCNELDNGSSIVQAFGGIPPYSFDWSGPTNIGTTSLNTVSGLAAGFYTVTVTDANGCSAIESFEIEQPEPLDIFVVSQTNIDCTGNASGSVVVDATGGTAAYSYACTSGVVSGSTISGLSAGIHNITVTDANGCTSSVQIVITQSEFLDVVLSAVNPSCDDESGSISLSVSGGTPEYHYLWNNGSTDMDLMNVGAGTYSVVVTDENDCSATASITLFAPQPITASVSTTDAACDSQESGSATIVPFNGFPPFTYSLSTGESNATGQFGTLASGGYIYTVEDANGCTFQGAFEIDDPNSLGLTASVSSNVSCAGGNNGAATAAGSGGTAPYTYTWSNGFVGANVNGLTAGVYTVTITDASGCSNSQAIEIDEPQLLELSSLNQTDVSCNGAADGSVVIIGTGGVTPYTYSSTSGTISGNLVFNLAAGSHTISVIDGNGCSANLQVTINQSASLQVSATGTNPGCNDAATGSIDVAVSGGTGAYSYLWSNGSTDQNQSNVGEGTYTVIVSDDNGCSASATVTLSNPQGITSTVSTTDADCNSNESGSVTINAFNGVAPYTYELSTGEVNSVGAFNTLASGGYIYTITDANGCSTMGSFEIDDPSDLEVEISNIDQVSCNGAADGSITLTASGGTAPYSFVWLEGGVDDVTANPSTSNGLTAGIYCIIIFDANGCSTVRTINLEEPTMLTIDVISQQDIQCGEDNSGSVLLNGTGGIPPYTFSSTSGSVQGGSVSNLAAGTHTITMTDASNCQESITVTIGGSSELSATASINSILCAGGENGSITVFANGGSQPYTYSIGNAPAQASNSFGNLSEGTYYITVEDANGCTTIVGADVVEPEGLSAIAAGSDATGCNSNDGSIQVTVSGGATPYIYSIDGNGGQASSAFGNLSAGVYTVTIFDANGCSTSAEATINAPNVPNCSIISVDDVTCYGGNDGELSVIGVGGSGTYEFSIDGGPFSFSYIFNDLTAGTHTVTVRNAGQADCSSTCSINIGQPDLLSCALDVTQVSCNGAEDGAATVSVSGGTAPYDYFLNNDYVGLNTSFDNLAPGNYEVTVRDANFCLSTCSFIVSEPTPLVATLSSSNVTDCGISNGVIVVNANGGTTPYTYIVNGEATSDNSISFLAEGAYDVDVMDANGCIFELSASISAPEPPVCVVESVTNANCAGDNTGGFTISATGGSGLYQFSLDGVNFSGFGSFVNFGAGTYTVTVRNSGQPNCTSQCTVEITEPAAFNSDATGQAPTCGAPNGVITMAATGGTAPYTYSIDGVTFQESAAFSNLNAGGYTVFAQDANGCFSVNTVILEGAAALSCGVTATNTVCNEGNGTLIATAAGGTMPYQYSLDGQSWQDSNVFAGLSAGEYNVWTQDANNCLSFCAASVGQDACLVDLNLSKSLMSDQVIYEVGDEVVFLLTVINEGPHDATNAVVVDELPEGMEFVSANSAAFDLESGLWSIPFLAAGGSVSLEITVALTLAEELNNFAQIIAVDQEDIDSETGNGFGNGQVANFEDDESLAGISVIFAQPDCTGFAAISSVVCDGADYTVYLSMNYAGVDNPVYTVVSETGATYTVNDGVASFGPFEGGTGYSYSVYPQGQPECAIVLSQSIVGCTTTALELLRFEGESKTNGNLLFWSTATEELSDYFTLQRSKDGVTFEDITKIDAAGYSNRVQDYSFLDQLAPAGISYYQLVSVDFNGEKEFSNIVTIERPLEILKVTKIYPNPTVKILNVEVLSSAERNLTLSIYDMAGRLVNDTEVEATSGVNTFRVDLLLLPTGLYTIEIMDPSTESVERLVFEKQ